MKKSPSIVSIIRSLYPDAQSMMQETGYCVMGAVGMFLEETGQIYTSNRHSSARRFPMIGDRISLLSVLNPSLSRGELYDYANDIAWLNDIGQVSEAWELLETAVNQKQEDK